MSPPRNIYISNSSDHNQDIISLFEDRDDEFQQQQSESMHNSLSSLDCSFDTSPTMANNNGQSHRKMGKRHNSFRRSFTHVISSPVKLAKDKISLPSPLRISRSMGTSIHKAGERILHPHKKEQQHPSTFSSLRDELDIPPEATRDEALAYMLLKELESIDL